MPPPIGRVHDSLESLGGESSGDLPRTIAGGGRDSVRKSGRRRSVLLSVGRLSEEELREEQAMQSADLEEVDRKPPMKLRSGQSFPTRRMAPIPSERLRIPMSGRCGFQICLYRVEPSK